MIAVWDAVSALIRPPIVLVSSDSLLQKRIGQVTMELSYIRFTYYYYYLIQFFIIHYPRFGDYYPLK